MRIASFDKQAVVETKNFVNLASLPPERLRPSGTHVLPPFSVGLHKPGDVENRLGYHVGQLRT
jgi:hypothetical protein